MQTATDSPAVVETCQQQEILDRLDACNKSVIMIADACDNSVAGRVGRWLKRKKK